MDIKIKKTIAKEGLVILGIFFAVFIFTRVQSVLFYLYCTKEKMPSIEKSDLMRRSDLQLNQDIWALLVGAYLLYFLIRFIIWAIRTLKQK